MKIHAIETGNFKLDGGAMFGVVPKSLWQRYYAVDNNNMCDWAMRCMLVEEEKRLILIDTGIGNKQNDKFFSHFFLHGEKSLDKSLAKLGFHRNDITDVFLTHLHFDHCGGAIEWNNSKDGYRPAFPNATYWSNESHWKWATEANEREKASFLQENILPIQQSGQLKFIKNTGEYTEELIPGFKALIVNGHTESQMIPHIEYKGKTVVFMADLLPSHAHIPLAWVMGYDTRPLLTLNEKKSFFQQAFEKDYVLFLEHDIVHECCSVLQNEKGIRFDKGFRFNEMFEC
ncbi:MAG: MBL fold metallo-hydrolase [Flavobacteriales bacterium]|jgi:glyoxylase-like metal-dependent hydrolase (beta-lactamase superfamily II)|tara:strand:- start:29 stop:889 length:861 start_codon:yes stop_codon:yes gene_type:complete